MIPGLGFLAGKAIPWKLIGGGVMLLIIGILLWVHLSGDRAKDNKITELHGLITDLEKDKVKLKTSNDSLEANIAKQLEDLKTINEEHQTLRLVDTRNQIELDAFRKERNSIERKKRIKNIASSRKISYLLRASNKQAKCQWDHYDDFSGKCTAGKFLKDGERLSPLIPEVKKDDEK